MHLNGLVQLDPKDEESLKEAAHILGTAFLEEGWTELRFAGLDALDIGLKRKREIMISSLYFELRESAKRGFAFTLKSSDGKGYDGILESYMSKECPEGFIALESQADKLFKASLAPEEVTAIEKQEIAIAPLSNMSWYKTFCKQGYYHLCGIAVKTDARGSGAFRNLITPLLNLADETGYPICLECYKEHLIGLYGHFGFKVAGEIGLAQYETREYLMIREPVA